MLRLHAPVLAEPLTVTVGRLLAPDQDGIRPGLGFSVLQFRLLRGHTEY